MKVEWFTKGFLFATVLVSPSLPYLSSIPVAHAEDLTFAPSKDTFVRKGAFDINEGANTTLSVRKIGQQQSLIAFDLSTLPALATGKTVASAKLRLYARFNPGNWGDNGRLVAVHRLVGDWSEGNGSGFRFRDPTVTATTHTRGTGAGATWKCPSDSNIKNRNTDCTVQWNGGNFASVATSTTTIQNTTEGQYVEFDVTPDVSAFLAGTATNFGWVVKRVNSRLGGNIRFNSREAAQNTPQLLVTLE